MKIPEHLLRAFPILGMDDYEAAQVAEGNPMVDQILKVDLGPSGHTANPKADEMYARIIEIPLVARIVERFHRHGVDQYVGSPWDYEYANDGRKPLPHRPGGHDLQKAAWDHAHKRGEDGNAFVRTLSRYWDAVKTADRGGSPLKMTVLLSPHTEGNWAFDVLAGYMNQVRIAKLAAYSCPVTECSGCGVIASNRLEDFLIIPCGGLELVAGLCSACEREVANEIETSNFDIWERWVRLWDDWYFRVGWPDCRWT